MEKQFSLKLWSINKFSVRIRQTRCFAWAAAIVLIALAPQPNRAAPAQKKALSDEELFAGADDRIEKIRKAQTAISVLDAAGQPVVGAKVTVEQTRHAFLFGSNIYKWGRCANEAMEAAYLKRLAELMNYVTVRFYWELYEPVRGEPNHAQTEQIARWCREHGILTKGHPLAWNRADPPWLPDDLEEVRRLQMARIEDCVSRFAGLIDRWDVLNEPTGFERPGFVRQAPKLSALWKKDGLAVFTRACFEHARKAGPKATLLINNHQADTQYERFIAQLTNSQDKRVYDAIGIQSHMHGGVWSNRRIWEVCERFSRFGVPLHFTEISSVSGRRVDGTWQPTTPTGEVEQAREVVRFYTMLFSHPAVEAITWWDLSDYKAWKGACGLIREDMSPKPAYDQLKLLIKGKWWTRASLVTGADGSVALRGFLGDYKVTVTAPGGEKMIGEFRLSKSDQNRWVVRLGHAR